jgi:DNA-binding MarR family transcriptional regulator
MHTEKRSIATQLSFALYGAANRMARLHKPLLDPLGLTFPQYLAVLELLDESPVSVGVLGSRLGMDTGTITPLVKRLEAGRVVTRTRDPSDERRVIVDLTGHGRSLEEQVRGVTNQIKTLCKLTDQSMDDLVLTLEALAHSPAA